MSYPWYGYVAIAVSVVLLIGLPLGGVIYALVSARGRQRKRIIVLVTAAVVIYGLLYAGSLLLHTHRRHGPGHAPGTTSVPASDSVPGR
jgi:hypothetical protein